MKKMIGIIMMVAGGILLVSGYFVYAAKKGKSHEEVMEKQIQAVVADGVFTDREKRHIAESADELGMDKKAIEENIEERIEAKKEDAETEIIDQAKKKGDDFEKFIVKKFKQKHNKKYFTIKQWAGDKYVDGVYDEQTQQPDIIVEFNYNGYRRKMAVECKYRSKADDGTIKLSYDEQLARYKDFEQKEKTGVYIALGLGGKASKPEELYLIPLSDLKKPEISTNQLAQYEKDVDGGFYFVMKTAELDLRTYSKE